MKENKKNKAYPKLVTDTHTTYLNNTYFFKEKIWLANNKK